jgi:hypothetical protein
MPAAMITVEADKKLKILKVSEEPGASSSQAVHS